MIIGFYVAEFDSVHGRILAVNMAHIRRKRQLPSNVSGGDENSFKGIEQANKGTLIGLRFTWCFFVLFFVAAIAKAKVAIVSSYESFLWGIGPQHALVLRVL